MLPRRSKSGTTFSLQTHQSQWYDMMKRFSRKNMEKCKTGLDRLEFPKTSLKMKEFPTGSMYEGEWDQFDMQGYGEYTFPNGVQYQGNFESGMFHGKGELVYPHDDDITVIRGRFSKGVMTERSLDFDDILDYREIDWKYCTMPDRRFAIEYVEKLKPAGQSYLTAQQPTKEIPEGFYDTGDGFFDPERKIICKYHDTSAIKRAPSTREQEWIIANCRKGINEPIGPRPDLYESWMGPMLKTSAAPVATVALQKQPQISISRKTSVFDYDGGADDDSRPLFYNFDEFASRFPEAENERFSKAPVRY